MSDFLVPDLGEGLQDATITSWAVAVGDVVELNQTLCTVETNKAEVEIPSPYAGRIVELGGAEGDTLRGGNAVGAHRHRGTHAGAGRLRNRRRHGPQPAGAGSPQGAQAGGRPRGGSARAATRCRALTG